jgi:hypothetical protein
MPAAGAATGGNHAQGVASVRSALWLLGGMAVSAAGIVVTIGSDQDLVGVLLIGAGVLVALLGLRVIGAGRAA